MKFNSKNFIIYLLASIPAAFLSISLFPEHQLIAGAFFGFVYQINFPIFEIK